MKTSVLVTPINKKNALKKGKKNKNEGVTTVKIEKKQAEIQNNKTNSKLGKGISKEIEKTKKKKTEKGRQILLKTKKTSKVPKKKQTKNDNIKEKVKKDISKTQNKEMVIKRKLKEIELKEPISKDWIEKLDYTNSIILESKEMNLYGNCEKRETMFLELAQEHLPLVLKKLQDLNIPFNRPYDFLADMLKNDKHMERVRSKILADYEKAENREKNKIKKLNKIIHKKSGSTKIKSQKEAVERKKNIEKIEELKQNKKLDNLDLKDFFLKHAKSSDDKKLNKKQSISEKKGKNVKGKFTKKNKSKGKKYRKRRGRRKR